jgi:PilZ domain
VIPPDLHPSGPRGPHFRAHARRIVRLRATVSHSRAGWERDADVFDIGLGGACISASEPMAEGDRVAVAFVAPSLWDPLLIPARVAWYHPGRGIEPARAGVAFDHVGEGAIMALFELVGTLAFE